MKQYFNVLWTVFTLMAVLVLIILAEKSAFDKSYWSIAYLFRIGSFLGCSLHFDHKKSTELAMRIWEDLQRALWFRFIAMKLQQPTPDFVVENPTGRYLERWYTFPRKGFVTKFFNLYWHKFTKSDDERALHDHPHLFNISIVLKGEYDEVTPKGTFRRRERQVIFRHAWMSHRVVLVDGRPAFTAFIVGPRIREWGFHCPKGWRHYLDFIKVIPGGNAVGRGCDD